MRRWSAAIGMPKTGAVASAVPGGRDRASVPGSAPPRRAARSVRGPAPRSNAAKARPTLSSRSRRSRLGRGLPRPWPSRSSTEASAAGLPERQSSQGKNRYQFCQTASAAPAGPRLAHQREIGDRKGAARQRFTGLDAVAVAEGVELLDIAELLARSAARPRRADRPRVCDARLPAGPRACLDRLASDAEGQQARLADRRGHDHRAEPDRQRGATAARGRDSADSNAAALAALLSMRRHHLWLASGAFYHVPAGNPRHVGLQAAALPLMWIRARPAAERA